MANFRVTFFFESQQQGQLGVGSSLGWTESWYKVSSLSLKEVIQDTDLTDYITFRTKFMPKIYRISFIRVNDEDHPRRFKIRGIGNTGFGKVTATDTDFGQVQCAVLVDLERMPIADGEAAHHRRMLLRGLPTDVINGNVLKPTGANWSAIRTFLDFVGNEDVQVPRTKDIPRFSWGIKYLNPTSTKHNIILATPSVGDANRLHLRCEGQGDFVPPGVGETKRVIVQGIPSPRIFNKTWNFVATTVIGGDTFLVLERSRERMQGEYNGPGTGNVRLASYLYGQVDQYVIVGLRNRKTGRSFHLLRGRSSRR